DAALARLLEGLRARGLAAHSNLVIVSDHGSTTTDPALRVHLDDVIPLADVRVVNFGVLAGVEPLPGKTAAIERALLAPHDHMRCWRKTELPKRFHYGSHARIPSLLCLAAPGATVTSRDYAARGGHYSAGEHGYDNAEPEMAAVFVAHGPAFRRGVVLPTFDGVDVYPLLAHLLGIRPAANDGDFSAVVGALREDPRAGAARSATSP
ncbi:MAG TPA: alkaline phosphatase family protein, partial [Dokdonella sp.]